MQNRILVKVCIVSDKCSFQIAIKWSWLKVIPFKAQKHREQREDRYWIRYGEFNVERLIKPTTIEKEKKTKGEDEDAHKRVCATEVVSGWIARFNAFHFIALNSNALLRKNAISPISSNFINSILVSL